MMDTSLVIIKNQDVANSSYAPIYNNNAMTDLFGITPNAYYELSEEQIKKNLDNKGRFRFKTENVTIIFDPTHLPVEERIKQFLVYILEVFTKRVPVNADNSVVNENKSIKFRYADIAKEFGLSYRQAKRLAIDAAEALQFTVFQFDAEEIGMEMHLSIVQDYTTWKEDSNLCRGSIMITLGEKLALMLPRMSIMWFPRNVRQIPVRLFPNASSFAMLLAIHYNRNFSKLNTDGIAVLGVKTMLNSTQEIPSYETVMQTNRMVYKRIIQPFIRDMDILVTNGILKHWDFVCEKEVIDKSLYSQLKYRTFIDSMVHYSLVNYPNKQRNKLLS